MNKGINRRYHIAYDSAPYFFDSKTDSNLTLIEVNKLLNRNDEHIAEFRKDMFHLRQKGSQENWSNIRYHNELIKLDEKWEKRRKE